MIPWFSSLPPWQSLLSPSPPNWGKTIVPPALKVFLDVNAQLLMRFLLIENSSSFAKGVVSRGTPLASVSRSKRPFLGETTNTMKNIRKMGALLGAGVVILGLAGCSDTNGNGQPDSVAPVGQIGNTIAGNLSNTAAAGANVATGAAHTVDNVATGGAAAVGNVAVGAKNTAANGMHAMGNSAAAGANHLNNGANKMGQAVTNSATAGATHLNNGAKKLNNAAAGAGSNASSGG